MDILNLWPTQVGRGQFDTSGLVEHIFATYDLEKTGEISGFNLLDDNSDVMLRFRDLILHLFDKYLQETIGKTIDDYKSHEMKAWITGHGKDYNMQIHNHSGAHLSGVFYLLSEEQGAGGDLVLHDPRTNANRGYDDSFDPMFERERLQPKTGDFMIFPSFTYHHVNPYYSSLRICVPVDLYLYKG